MAGGSDGSGLGQPYGQHAAYELVWREEQDEFIVGFGRGESRRRPTITSKAALADLESSSSSDIDDDDDGGDDELFSGMISSKSDLQKPSRGHGERIRPVEEDQGNAKSTLLDFLGVGACSKTPTRKPTATSNQTRRSGNEKPREEFPKTPEMMDKKQNLVTPLTSASTPFSCNDSPVSSSSSVDPAGHFLALNSAEDEGPCREPDIILNSPSDELLDAYPSCSSIDSVAMTLFQQEEEDPEYFSLPDRSLKSLPSTGGMMKPQHHTEIYGPIRRELPCLSDAGSEATTDLASNVTFAKLASTIISSQASTISVEPLDRIAQLLELHGVGRGTAGSQDVLEASSLRLFIDDYSEANFWPLLDSLYRNHGNLKKLVLFRRRPCDKSRIRTAPEMDCLFRVVNRLASSLVELHLWSFHPEDQGILARGLAHNSSLEYIQLHLERGSGTTGGSLSPLLAKSLTTLPSLLSLEVEVSQSFPLSILLEAPNLGVLSVICPESALFTMADEEMARVAQKLQDGKATKLHVLSLEPRISSHVALPRILQALVKGSNHNLETLQFSCTVSSTSEGDAALQNILESLNATSLRVLWNNSYESWSVSKAMQERSLEVLRSNTTLEHFHIFSESVDYWTEKSQILEREPFC